MREAVQTFSWFIFCRHVFEAAMRTFYGHGKCKIADSMIFGELAFVDSFASLAHNRRIVFFFYRFR